MLTDEENFTVASLANGQNIYLPQRGRGTIASRWWMRRSSFCPTKCSEALMGLSSSTAKAVPLLRWRRSSICLVYTAKLKFIFLLSAFVPRAVILSGAQRSRTEAKRRRASGISRGGGDNIVDPNASRCPPLVGFDSENITP